MGLLGYAIEDVVLLMLWFLCRMVLRTCLKCSCKGVVVYGFFNGFKLLLNLLLH